MNLHDLICFGILVATHAIAYYMGKADAPEPYKPNNEAWVAVQCYALDKQYEHQRWLNERDGSTAESSD